MKKQVFAYLHTHFDREWYRSKEEFNLRLLEIFDEIIEELEKNNAPCFYFDGQTDAIKNYLKFRPEKEGVIKKLVKEKKLYFGPFSTLADSFLTSKDFLKKNLESGITYAKSFGVTDFIGYLADTFGHSATIFEVLKEAGIKNAILWRGVPSINADFNANGINCARLVNGYANDLFHNGADVETIEKFIDDIAKYSNDKILLPIGSDHLKILTNASEKIEKINEKLKKYEIKLTSPFEYFKNFTPKAKIEGEFLSNENSFILQGVYTSWICQKVKNAKLQFEISNVVEPFNEMMGGKYAPSLNFACETLIKNHAHDSIYGCTIDEVQNAVSARFLRVDEIVRGVKSRLIRDFMAKNPLDCSKIGAINFSNCDYSGVVRVKSAKKIKNAQIIEKNGGFEFEKLNDTAQIPITEDYKTIFTYLLKSPIIPAQKYLCFEPQKPSKKLKIDDTKIENEFVELFVKSGKINFKNKITNEKLDDVIELKDTKNAGDSYNFAPASKPQYLKIIKSEIFESGDFRSILQIFYKNLTLDCILYDGAKHFEFIAKTNNVTKNHKLQVQFNLKNKIFETSADNFKRIHNPNYNLAENLPAPRPHEAKTNIFPMLRYVYLQNFGITTLGLNEYEIYKNTISIPILCTFSTISNPKNPARSIPAGPPLQTPKAQLPGKNEAKFAICMCENENEIKNISDIFYGSIVAFCK